MSRESADVRRYRSDDLERIREITVAAWRPPYEHYRENMGEELFRAKYGDWEEHKAGQVATQCRRAPERVRVATLDSEVVGYVTFKVDGGAGIGTIGNNAVDPAYQGHGIGTTMYEHILEEFRDRGLSYAEVSTGLTEVYAPARAAYERVGFDIRRPHVTYWQEL